MARAPFQILAIPFCQTDDGLRVAILRRADTVVWQFVAGGGEDDETPLQAARREIMEELGVVGAPVYPLDTRCSIPANCFRDCALWGERCLVIPEYAFAVRVRMDAIRLSHEHSALQWETAEDAAAQLRYDSNRTALYELKERLARGWLADDTEQEGNPRSDGESAE